MLDYSTLADAALKAAGILILVSPAVAALVELVKVVVKACGWPLPTIEFTNALAGVLSVGLTLPAVLAAGVVWPVAVLACIIAVFGPKTVYDAATVSGDRKNQIKGTP
jgi:hypothetical protein